ncbi:MAG: Ig-like domain-containing protein, partial [Pirellulales bacterium]
MRAKQSGRRLRGEQLESRLLLNSQPILTRLDPLLDAVEDQDFAISYASLLAASDASDVDGDALSFRIESLDSGTLTLDSVAVVPGETLLATGQSLIWHPSANANGSLGAFSVRAW